jgi:hypothetical protein
LNWTIFGRDPVSPRGGLAPHGRGLSITIIDMCGLPWIRGDTARNELGSRPASWPTSPLQHLISGSQKAPGFIGSIQHVLTG